MNLLTTNTAVPSVTEVRPLMVQESIFVGTHDIDFAGHVSNLVYLRWFEDLRLKVFDVHFPLQNFIEEGLMPVLSETHVEYKRPVRLFDKPIGQTWIAGLGYAKILFEGQILLDSQVCTRQRVVVAFIDKSQRPVKLPAAITKLYEEAAGSA